VAGGMISLQPRKSKNWKNYKYFSEKRKLPLSSEFMKYKTGDNDRDEAMISG
jgi:hypothetical protein